MSAWLSSCAVGREVLRTGTRSEVATDLRLLFVGGGSAFVDTLELHTTRLPSPSTTLPYTGWSLAWACGTRLQLGRVDAVLATGSRFLTSSLAYGLDRTVTQAGNQLVSLALELGSRLLLGQMSLMFLATLPAAVAQASDALWHAAR
jgi:hypothetical protein